jgi:hypothetical protein
MGNPWGKSGGLGKTWKNRRNMRANLGNYGKTISWENPWKPLYSIPFQYRPLYKVVPASYGSCFGQPPMNYRWTKLFGRQPKVTEYAMEIWKYDGTLILDTLLGMFLGIANRYMICTRWCPSTLVYFSIG